MWPIIFETKYFILNTYWIFFAIGLAAGVYFIIRQTPYNSLKIQFLSQHSWKLIIAAIIFGRILFIINNLFLFSNTSISQILFFWDGGISGWGAIIGILGTIYFLCRKYEQNFWLWLDNILPGIILVLCITNLGAFFDGSNYGHETNLPWGVNFENMFVKYTVPIHPTQIYAALYSLAIFFALILVPRLERYKKIAHPGLIGVSGIFIYSIFRFIEEFFRGDDTWIIFSIRLPSIISFIVMIIAGIFLYLRYNEAQKQPKN